VKIQHFLLILCLLPILSGCTEDLEGTLKPDLEIEVLNSEYRNETEEGYLPTSGNTWLYLTLNITNNNEEGSVPITAYHFFLLNEKDEVWCRGFEGDLEPDISPGNTEVFIIYFEVEINSDFDHLEYRRTLKDPIRIEF
jgi:hypothetical protein